MLTMRLTILLSLAFLLSNCQDNQKKITTNQLTTPSEGNDEIINILNPIRDKYKLPAIAAAIINQNGITKEAVVGIRKEGSSVAARLTDKWMIGSNTKPMTATLIAKLIELGKINWDSNMHDIFPDLADNFTDEFKTITVTQLLSHYSGIERGLEETLPPGWNKMNSKKLANIWAKIPKSNKSLVEQRRELLIRLGKTKLEHKPGTNWQYSNPGYMVLGAITDKVSGMSYEKAMHKYIFKPLNMTTAGFDRGNKPGEITEPFSHFYDGESTTITLPRIEDPNGGRTYMSLSDWGKFIADQIRGSNNLKPALLKQESYKILHTPVNLNNRPKGIPIQALGFEIKGDDLFHTGTDILNFAIGEINIKQKHGFAYCTNIGMNTADLPDNDDDIPVQKAGLIVIDKPKDLIK